MSFRYGHGDRPLEGYTILRGIGRGGFGEVYYAVSDGGREVALKVIQQNHEIELRGIQHCINLKSPHLVSIFDVRTNSEGTPFVIMEYVAGPSLREILRAAPEGLGVEKSAFLAREIARGLAYLHDRGIVHRDLKPENIFFEDGFVKIGDYGLSKYISVSRQSGQTISVGTVHYMAPEIGSGSYSKGIDIYALGVIFYELLTGRVPFEGSSMGEILIKHLTAEPDLSPIPEALRPVVARALAKNPKDRFASGREFSDALLGADDLRRRLEGFDPGSLSAHPGLAEKRAPEVPPAPAAPGAVTTPLPPPEGAKAGTPRATVPPPLPVEAQESRAPRECTNLPQRLVHGAITATAMAFAVSLFTRNLEDLLAYLFAIVGCAAAVGFVEYRLVARANLRPGILRRLAALGCGIPVLFLAQALGLQERLIPALLLGLAVVDWSARTKLFRREQVSLELSVFPAVAGVVLAAIFGADPLAGAGLLAAISLTTEASAPFLPLSERPGRHRSGLGPGAPSRGGVSPRSAAAAPPPPPVPPPTFTPEAPPPPKAGSRGTQLVRLRDDRWLAGVAGGLARAYGWDPVWVRVAFLLLTVFGGLGPILYLVFWICMPLEPAPLGASRFRVLGFLGRVFWTGLAAAFVILAIGCAAGEMHLFGRPTPGDHVLGTVISAAGAIASLVLALVTPIRTGLPARASRSGAGWSALGSVFFALALLSALIGVLLASGAGAEIFGPRFGRHSLNLEHYLGLPGVFYLLGLFFVLLGRRDGGPAHVFRGAVGWILAGALAGFAASAGPALFEAGRPRVLEPIPNPATVSVLAVLSVLLIAWPKKPERGRPPSLAAVPPSAANAKAQAR